MFIKKKSLSYFILLALEKTVNGYVSFEDFACNPGFYAQGMREVRKSELAQVLKRLRERGLIEKEKNIDEDKVILKLTELGKDILGETFFKEESWDGRWRIVIFDIPEEKRRIRNLFRRKLKHWGFRNWQQSVWVTKNNVTDKLRKSIVELGVDKWVAVLESDNVSTDNNLFNGR